MLPRKLKIGEVSEGIGIFNADSFLQSGNVQTGGQVAVRMNESIQQISSDGLLANAGVTVLKQKIREYATALSNTIRTITEEIRSKDVEQCMYYDFAATKTIAYGEAAQVANDILNVNENLLALSNYIIKARDSIDNDNSNGAASNLTALMITSNNIIVTSNIHKISERRVEFANRRTDIGKEASNLSNIIRNTNTSLITRIGQDITNARLLSNAVNTDYNTLLGISSNSRGGNYQLIVDSFASNLNRIRAVPDTLISKSNSYVTNLANSSTYPVGTLAYLYAQSNYQYSNTNSILLSEYDISSVKISTCNVVSIFLKNMIAFSNDLPLNTRSNSTIFASNMDISGWFWRNFYDLSGNINSNLNTVFNGLSNLESNTISEFGTDINSIYSNLATALNLQNNLSSNFTNWLQYDSNAMLLLKYNSNVTTSNTFRNLYNSIYSNTTGTGGLVTRYQTALNNVRNNYQSNINDQHAMVISNFNYISNTIPYISSTITTASNIMRSSNYNGKYSHFFDYIYAMMGFQSNILQMANNGTFPKVATPNNTVYSSNLYSNNLIILGSNLYKNINNRYLGSNYRNIYNSYINAFNGPKSDLNSIRQTYYNILSNSSNPIVDAFQLSNYSNLIVTDPNSATSNGLVSYLRLYFEAVASGNNDSLSTQQYNIAQSNWDKIRQIVPTYQDRVTQILNNTEYELYYLLPTDFTYITTKRGDLKNNYMQSDFIFKDNGQYFSNNFSRRDSNGVLRQGNFFQVYQYQVIATLNTYITGDTQTVSNYLYNDPLIVGTGTASLNGYYSNARNGALSNIRSSIQNMVNTANTNISTIRQNITNTLRVISNDVPQLSEKRMNSGCFGFYNLLLQTSNDANKITNNVLPSLQSDINNVNSVYSTSNSLAYLDTLRQNFMATSNTLCNLVNSTASYYDNINGKAVTLLIAYSNAYNNLTPEQIASLPMFQLSNCT
jgi:hypothetical protein